MSQNKLANNPLDSLTHGKRSEGELSITDINPGEVVIKKDSDDEHEPDPSISGVNTSGVQTPFTPNTDQQKPPAKDLKEFTLNKFNMLEPFMIK